MIEQILHLRKYKIKIVTLQSKNVMSEELFISTGIDKKEIYESLIPQLASLIDNETDLTANLANIAAALHQTFNWWWVGFYLVKNNELVLAPFQGPIACTRIKYGKGVCGTAWKNEKAQLVPDVHQFDGHIACSSNSVAEIVVPVLDKTNKVIGVLDVDSEHYNVLDETDVYYLKIVSQLITNTL
jgi:GAF domain-containing protein